MASGGYPESYPKGIEIKGLKGVEAMSGVKVFHAGTQLSDTGACVTSGGRVLGVTALGNNLTEATAAAYRAVEAIDFTGCHFRRDIAAKAL
jgi:phosphoribosylamine--glycine ligase